MKIDFHRLFFVQKKLLRGLGLVAYTFLLAEVFLQIFAPQPLMPRHITGAAWGVRRNIPDSIYRHSTAEVDVAFHINHAGMRADHEIGFAKEAGRCRLAMLGDSFFMGYELNFSDTLAARLEQRLKADGYAVEVLNFAVSGFGTAESFITYDKYARQFSPDLVLLEWDRSDFDDNMRSGLFSLQDGVLRQDSKSYLPSVALLDNLNTYWVYRELADHSDLYAFLRERLSLQYRNLQVRIPAFLSKWAQPGEACRAGTEAPRSCEVATALDNPKHDLDVNSISLSAALLQRFKQQTEKDKVGFLILEIPYRVTKSLVVSTMHAFPDEVSRELPTVSPVDLFMEELRDRKKLFYEKGDGHVTPEGVRLMLEVSVPAVERSGALAQCHHGS